MGKEERLLKKLQKKTEIKTPIGTELFIPNYSGLKEGMKKTDADKYIVTETDPIFSASEAANFVAGDKANLDNQSGVNTGDQVAGNFNHDDLANIPANEHIDWTNTSSNLNTSGTISGANIYSSGNVGIGVSSPAYKLEVADVDKAMNISSVLYVNGSSGNVGIGTATPNATLDVNGNVNFGSEAPVDADISVTYSKNRGDYSLSNYYGVYSYIDSYRVSNWAGSGAYAGYFKNIHARGSNNYGVGVYGESLANYFGDDARGVWGVAKYESTDPLPQPNSYLRGVIGQISIIENEDIDEPIFHASSFYAQADVADTNPAVDLTSYYGIYLDTLSGAGTITNKYGIYQEDTSADNYFAGDVGIGTTTPSNKLDVRGRGNFSGTIYINNVTDISEFASTYNETYATWAYNQTAPAFDYTDVRIGVINTTANVQNLLNGTALTLGELNTTSLCISDVCLSNWDGVNGSSGGGSLWGTDGTNIYNLTANVGIGTATPDAFLHLYNQGGESGTEFIVEETTDTKRPAFYLKNDLGERAGIFYYGSNTASYAGDLRIHMDNSARDAHFTGMSGVGILIGNDPAGTPNAVQGSFQVNPDDSSVFVVEGDGKVGIGTSAPSTALEVVGTISGSSLVASDGWTGDFLDSDAQVVTVVNGIITDVS
jgi:hypothetical protein